MKKLARIVLLVAIGLVAAPHLGQCAAESAPSLLNATFSREVVNLEDNAGLLGKGQPRELHRAPAVDGELWYGQIFRQLPGDLVGSREHSVTFAVQFHGADVSGAWCDANFNGDLSDDPRLPLSLFPGARAARSFLVPLQWTTRVGDRAIAVDRLVRVVVESPDLLDGDRKYRTQNVYGMLGSVKMNGVTRLALLHDANGDGLYQKANSDGVFFDLDEDRHFQIDVMARDFGPFALPFSIGGESYSVESIDIEGKNLTLRSLGPSAEQPPPTTGLLAPDFSYLDVQGRPVALSRLRGKVVLVYFWSSWCASCRRHADAVAALYKRYDRSQLEILGVSNDVDRGAMARFRTEHGHTWPTSFTGGSPAEDPVGRLYRETGSGVFYVVGPDGRLVSREYEVDKLEESLTGLITKSAEALGSAR